MIYCPIDSKLFAFYHDDIRHDIGLLRNYLLLSDDINHDAHIIPYTVCA